MAHSNAKDTDKKIQAIISSGILHPVPNEKRKPSTEGTKAHP
jgi:hypothetical protein